MDAVSLLPDTTRPSTRPHTGATSGALALAMASIKLQSKYNLSHHTMTEARVKLPRKGEEATEESEERREQISLLEHERKKRVKSLKAFVEEVLITETLLICDQT